MSGFRPGEEVRHYRIVREIARTMSSSVYEARHSTLDVTVAIKQLIRPHLADPTLDRRFEIEAKALAGLLHPNVVVVHDYFIHDDDPLIVMEFFRLGTAKSLAGRLSAEEVVGAAHDVLSGLKAAHAQRILHRDIKPENLMRADHGALKISDFGIAKVMNPEAPQLTPADLRPGTVRYMAPELHEGSPASPASDIYAVGAVLYELIAGSPPYGEIEGREAVITRKRSREPIPIEAGVPALDARIAAFVRRLMKRDPRERPTTADEALRSLDAVVREIGLAPASLPIADPAARDELADRSRASRFAPWSRLIAIAAPRKLIGNAIVNRYLVLPVVMVAVAVWLRSVILAVGGVVAGAALVSLVLFDESEAWKARARGARHRER